MLHTARSALLSLAVVFTLLRAAAGQGVEAAPNHLLIITTDDMSCDSVGAFGSKLAGITPHMDALAARGMRFAQAHVVVGNCMPSRNVMWSGRYPHHNGIEGFRSLPKEAVKYPVLGDLMKAGGWFTGIRGKVDHSTPYAPFPWDIVLDTDAAGGKVHPKDAPSYGATLKQGMAAAKQAGKPFCLMLNVSDPHKPFYAEGKGGKTVPDEHVPSRVYTPEEVPVPGFLHDDPVIRKELAHYYSSVRRADDAVGAILTALKESGEEERTVILFLSDHGMPLPFAKTQLYHHSSRTPLMVVWPGVTKPGSVDEAHLISTVDLLPTLLEITGQPLPEGLDGRSFAPLLKGETQTGRDIVYKSYHENSGGQITPMRAVQTKDFLYLFNPWSNGTRVMGGATVGTATASQMRVLARTDETVAARMELFDHRRPEEAYDVRYDADALTNLIDLPAHAAQVTALEKAMEEIMIRTGDPLLEVFQKRHDSAFREAFMETVGKKTVTRQDRKKMKGSNKKGGRKKGQEKTDDE
ncbi:N-sulfoglucosamine sulfohydrolase [Prosthecobacter fusiformis]|uniref:N-sulfoglucosamine sulfohydrolase n=1 Tax=Prosthecobacter fusiformis TaxID=48464 RepID=A0A4R7RIY1_9BACT|nr:sulfatase [Prosthecobacter fusiformis]TDU64097.1 N-sulfoglucosamine sulfohydrolase [Prosthecobacter fusiformis]